VGKRERASPLGKGGDRRLGELETLLTPRATRKRDGTAARCRASPVTVTQSNRKFAGLETDYIKEGVYGGNE
jgi:hypothetical protein